MLRDPDIRAALHRRLRLEHKDDAETEIVDEFSICRARARVDIAVVNGCLAGYEIKSDVDRLDRLPAQTGYYDRVFDTVTVVAVPRHLPVLERRLHKWYGITAAVPTRDGVRFDPQRAAAQNPQPCPFARAQLLWREDMVELLLAAGAERTVTRQARRLLIPAVLEAVPADKLFDEIRRRVRLRVRSLS